MQAGVINSYSFVSQSWSMAVKSLYSSAKAPSRGPNLFLNSLKYCLAFLSLEIIAINSLYAIPILLSSGPGLAVSYVFKTA